MALIFSDGMEIKDTGPYRIIEELDGLYVAGNGILCPVNTREEGQMLIRELLSPNRGDATKAHGTLLPPHRRSLHAKALVA